MPATKQTEADAKLREAVNVAHQTGDALAALGLDAVELIGEGTVTTEAAQELRFRLERIANQVAAARERFFAMTRSQGRAS